MPIPQQLSRKAIDEFKAIYRDEFDAMLSDDEAQEMGLRLLRFFAILNGSVQVETDEACGPVDVNFTSR